MQADTICNTSELIRLQVVPKNWLSVSLPSPVPLQPATFEAVLFQVSHFRAHSIQPSTRMLRTPSSPQITSKGCSRGFILCVLYRALDYARQQQMMGHAIQFPFCVDEINRWLLVRSSCQLCSI